MPGKLPVSFTTRDGRRVTIRHIQPDDAPRLVALFYRLSERTRRFRFHAYGRKLPDEYVWKQAVALSTLDPQRQAALVAVATEEGAEAVVGVARFSRAAPDDDEAEAAIVVCDDYQGVGLGTRLLTELVHVARAMGIRHFVAWVLHENRPMLRMIAKAGLPYDQHTSRGETKMVVHLDAIDRLWEMMDGEVTPPAA
ncbi:MAG: N-acetyltransferase [Caldilineae bacterium]|nr:MAG: N-acetyltransferase [Caldilineae bacterium]